MKNFHDYKTWISLGALAGALCLPPSLASAGQSDVDLFTGGANLPPNILILLDNSGSMDRTTGGSSTCNATDSTAPDACKRIIASDAIANVVNTVNPYNTCCSGPRTETARFGLMTFVSQGASVEAEIATGSSDAVIAAAAALASRSVGTPIDGALLDAGRYFAGTNQWDADGAVGPLVGLPLWGAINTVSPAEAVLANPIDLSCRESYVVYISDGLPNNDAVNKTGYWDTIGDADGDSGAGEGDPENIGPNPTAAQVADPDIEWGDDIAHAMAQYDFRPDLSGTQNVKTHMIGFAVNDPQFQRIADAGLGDYYPAGNAAQLGTALGNITTQVFDDLADFSSAVVPTSRSLSGSAFYNVYFEPTTDPIWAGHIEAYHVDTDGTILDAASPSQPATDANGEFIEPRNPFWDAASGTNGVNQNTSRTIWTTIGGSRVAFETANAGLTDVLLGVTAPERTPLIQYVHGYDSYDEDGDTITNELRPNALGDIFHSTPRIVAAPSRFLLGEGGYATFHGDYEDRDRVLYAGANDGMLHAFDAGAYSTGDDPITTTVEDAANVFYSVGDGSELFGYVPGELIDDLYKLPINTPRTFYFVDGSPIHAEAWLGDGTGTDTTKTDDEWATVMITGMREGGENYLALDVTDPGATSSDDHFPYPSLLWEFTDANLGQAWSDAIITRVKVKGAAASGDLCGAADGDGDCREHWVAIVGGGYLPEGNPNRTADYLTPVDAGWSTKSKAIFMISLDTGAVLSQVVYDSSAQPDMVYSIPSTPAVLDLDSDGFADVVYVGDLGGQLWKWDISAVGTDGPDADTLLDNWTAGVIFRNSPQDMGAGVFHYRSIFFPPSAAYDRGVLTLAFGSGEREDLRYAGVSGVDDNNRYWVVQDAYPVGAYAFVDATATSRLMTEANLTDVTSTMTDTNLADAGFYFIAEEGEKFTSESVIFAGFVITTAYQPSVASADPCLALSGESFLYVFSLRNAGGFYEAPGDTAAEARRVSVGEGLASSPRVSMGKDPDDDKVYVKTSKGTVLPIEPPKRTNNGASVLYWKQNF